MMETPQNRSAAPDQADGSVGITDQALIERFTDNPDFPYLISFPRTGSHWLRMLMELYFDRPSLIRAFYFKQSTEFTCYHWHDIDLKSDRRNVLYLYRHPVATVFSQMNYYREDVNDIGRIRYWSELYGQHLRKWLIMDDFTIKKTVLTFEGMQRDLLGEFEKVSKHFGTAIDADKLARISMQVTKEELKSKTHHDEQVVNLSVSYERQRKAFLQCHSAAVLAAVLSQHPALSAYFNEPR
jgi:hypothetical protein